MKLDGGSRRAYVEVTGTIILRISPKNRLGYEILFILDPFIQLYLLILTSMTHIPDDPLSKIPSIQKIQE